MSTAALGRAAVGCVATMPLLLLPPCCCHPPAAATPLLLPCCLLPHAPLRSRLPAPSSWLRARSIGLAWSVRVNDSTIAGFDSTILRLQEDGTVSTVRWACAPRAWRGWLPPALAGFACLALACNPVTAAAPLPLPPCCCRSCATPSSTWTARSATWACRRAPQSRLTRCQVRGGGPGRRAGCQRLEQELW